MASEDSGQLVPGFPPIHRLHDFGDLHQTVKGQVATVSHELHAICELLEVTPLGSPQGMPPEEGNHLLKQILPSTNGVAMQVLPMVVRPPVDVHLSRSEELAELVEAGDATRALRYHEIVRDLVSGLVASSTHAVRLPHESDREASFSVYKTDHPATLLGQPFLLVFRTRHVVTIVNVPSDGTMSSAGYSGFPAYSQMHTALLPARGAANVP
jgi:hypothetical protein